MNTRSRVSALLLGCTFLLSAQARAEGSVQGEAKAPAQAPAAAEKKMTAEEVMRHIDGKMAFASDYKGTVHLLETRTDGTKRAMEVVVYRREKSRDLLFLVTQPSHLAGQGYLRIGRNLWEYDPATGSWRRSTQRTNVLNTFTCESDFDRSRLAEDYSPTDEGEETVNGVTYRKFLLKARPSAVGYELLRLWVDPQYNIVKRVGYGASGRPLRTDLVRSYRRIKDPVSNESVLHYKEVLEQDEQQGMQILVRYDEVELAPLDANIFTKAWLESRVR